MKDQERPKVSATVEVMTMGDNAEDKYVIAVSISEMREFGCPYCGYRSGFMPISCGGSALWKCGDCDKECCVLANGVTKSAVGFNSFYPELQSHPRRGTPSHGRPDRRPEGGG